MQKLLKRLTTNILTTMTKNIDAIIDKILLDVYYKVWNNHPKLNKQESFWNHFDNCNMRDEVEDIVNWELKFHYTEEQINSISNGERAEMIRFIEREIKNRPREEYKIIQMRELVHAIIRKDWKYIFNAYSHYYAPYHFNCCSSLPYWLYDMVLKDFKFKTAIAKVKRNQIFILGLSMKLSMRDCGIELTPISQKLLDEK